MTNLNVDDDFWASDSESIARYIHDQVGIIEDYHCEIDWSLVETVCLAPAAVPPKYKWLRNLLKIMDLYFD
ncbi:MAG: hypothetical protein WAN66_16405 [Limnoraphis robusta]|jgi:hypothetical protein|uniref:Uncharacterized protein n=2 Tax=Limnoraphis robusta TaxID=1118279 RepID=A0A0F5YEF1_9CYAN|nr:hypothetical protein [Limnoraphis robusta]MCG5059502.1 hypothetical protein [Limnoraphis sp. WC205]KKD37256.1 hypothetical protein WN50_15370 [Limnoraphis robusta CS-951]MEA5499354.1 hypothetical protein [Limnoraphis robusta BA-68 BA1]MEA5520008.1 hypothetical protein [Limnoraphis robusta CCNP1315]MEA5540017.1 hypothetical protein [Limnoraphis robusta Tam1]